MNVTNIILNKRHTLSPSLYIYIYTYIYTYTHIEIHKYKFHLCKAQNGQKTMPWWLSTFNRGNDWVQEDLWITGNTQLLDLGGNFSYVVIS